MEYRYSNKYDKESFEGYRTVLDIVTRMTDFSVEDLEEFEVVKSKSYDSTLGDIKNILSSKYGIGDGAEKKQWDSYKTSMFKKGDRKSRGHEFVRNPEEEADNPFAEFFYHARCDEAFLIATAILLEIIKSYENGVTFKELRDSYCLEERLQELIQIPKNDKTGKRILDTFLDFNGELCDIEDRKYKKYLEALVEENLIKFNDEGKRYFVSDNPLDYLFRRWGEDAEKWNRLTEYCDFLGRVYAFPAPFIFLRDRLTIFIDKKLNVDDGNQSRRKSDEATPYIVYRHDHCERILDSEVVAEILTAIKRKDHVKRRHYINLLGYKYTQNDSDKDLKRGDINAYSRLSIDPIDYIEYDTETGNAVSVQNVSDGSIKGAIRVNLRQNKIESKNKKRVTSVFSPLRNRGMLENAAVFISESNISDSNKVDYISQFISMPLKAEKDALKNIIKDLPGKEIFLTHEMCRDIGEAMEKYEASWDPKDIVTDFKSLPNSEMDEQSHVNSYREIGCHSSWIPKEPDDKAIAVRAEYSCKYNSWRILYFSGKVFYYKGAKMSYELLERVKRESSESLRKKALERRIYYQISIPYGTKNERSALSKQDIWIWAQTWISKLLPYGCSKRFAEDPEYLKAPGKPDIYYPKRRLKLSFYTEEEDFEEIKEIIYSASDSNMDVEAIKIYREDTEINVKGF